MRFDSCPNSPCLSEYIYALNEIIYLEFACKEYKEGSG